MVCLSLACFPMQSPVPVLQTLAALCEFGTLLRARCPRALSLTAAASLSRLSEEEWACRNFKKACG